MNPRTTARWVWLLEDEHTARRLRGREAIVLDERVFGTPRRTWLWVELDSGEHVWIPEARTEPVEEGAAP